MCAARRQRDVALHMMSAPKLDVSLFKKKKTEKEQRPRGRGLVYVFFWFFFLCVFCCTRGGDAYDQHPGVWRKPFFSFHLFPRISVIILTLGLFVIPLRFQVFFCYYLLYTYTQRQKQTQTNTNKHKHKHTHTHTHIGGDRVAP
jgi:hypothetical protein